jgi:hypothetical protein
MSLFQINNSEWPDQINDNAPIGAVKFIYNSFKSAWPNCDSFIPDRMERYWTFGKHVPKVRIAAFICKIDREHAYIVFSGRNTIHQLINPDADFHTIIKTAIQNDAISTELYEGAHDLIRVKYPITYSNKKCVDIFSLTKTLENIRAGVVNNPLFQ